MILHLINYKDQARGGAQKILAAVMSAIPSKALCLDDSKFQNKFIKLLNIYWQVWCQKDNYSQVVIHSRMYLPLVPLLKLRGIKSVYYLHAMYRRKAWLMSLFKADAYIAVSNSSKAYLIEQGVTEKCIHVVPNPLLNNTSYPIKLAASVAAENNEQATSSIPKVLGHLADEVNVFSIGSLEVWKGFESAINALGEWAKQDNISVVYTIIGAGSEQENLETCARKHQKHGLKVNFLGKIEDPFEQVSDIFIQLIPSLEEGFGLVAIEGIFHGKSLIYRKIPALSECCKKDPLSYGFDDPYQMVQMIKIAVHDRCLINDLNVYKQRKKTIELNYGYGKFKQRVDHILSKI